MACFFARGVYTPETVLRALAVAGFERTTGDLERLGAGTLWRKHAFKRREGFDWAQLRISRRILEAPSALGAIDEDFLRRTIELSAEGARA